MPRQRLLRGRRSPLVRGVQAAAVATAVGALLCLGMTAASAQPASAAQLPRSHPIADRAPGLARSSASSSRVYFSLAGSWPPHLGASCPDVEFLGARGSGQPSGGQFKGLGPEISYMFSVVQSDVRHDGYSYRTWALNYPAVSVDVLKPSAVELMTGAMGLLYWYNHNYKKFQASISEGVGEMVAQMSTLHSACPHAFITVGGYSQGAMVVHQALLRVKSKSVQKCQNGTILLADGNRVPNTIVAQFGSSPRDGEGIATWAKYTIHVGATPRDIPKWANQSAANICNKYDIVCDTSLSNLEHFSRGARVHTSYAVRDANGKYSYEKVLTQAASGVGGDLQRLLLDTGGFCA
jgi:hypothetical protein